MIGIYLYLCVSLSCYSTLLYSTLYSLDLANWPFLATTNKLKFGVRLSQKGGEDDTDTAAINDDNGSENQGDGTSASSVSVGATVARTNNAVSVIYYTCITPNCTVLSQRFSCL